METNEIKKKRVKELLESIRLEAYNMIDDGDNKYVDVEHMIADLALLAHEHSMFRHYMNSFVDEPKNNVIEFNPKKGN